MAVRKLSICLLLLALWLHPASLPAQTTKKKSSTAQKKKESRKSAQNAARLRHIKRAFVASADLKPMAQQLLENRSPQAYAGVEEYAHRHRKDDAGPLAWLVLGYAH